MLSLTNKEIEFLENLEIRLAKQADVKTKNIKDKLLISNREFQKFWDIVEKIERERDNKRKSARGMTREKRKLNKGYGRPNYYKQYLKDKEDAKRLGIKFTKKIKDYKNAKEE